MTAFALSTSEDDFFFRFLLSFDIDIDDAGEGGKETLLFATILGDFRPKFEKVEPCS